ncbi:NLE domain containing protein [Entamoeba histolytica HM-1:IMSS-B]|uniref:Ribosome biogenesis protein WDR12 homolog n=6 Tax=Entamoeba histolytica TaxID=5759 RepID=C4LYY7_ENTH1|nr:WD repeat protein [Entamoeba histolytica HM-1:IMSS]EMD42711.1 WD repeatcontaining protein [Entamoeba histolytica KU27]EMH72972.1 NLE domain containing protein [Entamoeba histolytica HM-1:IMSS-B]EMS15675.1 Hypothetical protein KM1_003400 [Entamoeba histolytica HM-3:IMSS]ENY63373.1 NLE domain containing protein [Entamoeba histolytica HM-1:IMSS-A]GAT94054.1 wd repeat protein [Entamoeba histolytica]|eukprot:XP_656053.1 WD repeat protein [Entamoeba histolytica HM-1:IMSS]
MTETTILVRFSTKLDGFQVSTTTFNVPSDSNRLALSRLINHLLQLPKVVPFDFIVGGEFLRTTLQEHLKEKNIPIESTVDIEYTVALPAPQPEWYNQQENWVTSLSYCSSFLFAGIANQSISANNESGIVCSTDALLSDGTTKRPVKTIDAFDNNGKIEVACGGKSNNIHIFSFENNTFLHRSILTGHNGSIESLCYSPNGTHLVSGGWDKKVNVWDLNSGSTLQTTEKRSRSNVKTISEFTSLDGHLQAVTHCIWPVEKQILSSSLDGTIAIWDIQNTALASAYKTSKVATALDYSTVNSLIATGHNDSIIRLADPRESQITMKLLKSHKNLVTCVAWHPQSAYLLASAGYDNSIKIWDIRSITPLCTIPFSTKMTAVCWNETGDIFYSAGANGFMKAHKFTHTN